MNHLTSRPRDDVHQSRPSRVSPVSRVRLVQCPPIYHAPQIERLICACAADTADWLFAGFQRVVQICHPAEACTRLSLVVSIKVAAPFWEPL